MTLNEYLNKSLSNKQINESLILSAIVCTACVGYAVSPLLNTEFFKSVGSGLGGLFSGIGSLFKSAGDKIGSKEDKTDNIDNIKSLLQKDPDDLTGKEKKLLSKVANNPKMQDEFSNNDLKKLDNITKAISKDNDSEDNDSEDNKSEDTKIPMEALLAIASKANENEKDSKKKAEMESLIDLISTSCYDKDGNSIPMEEREQSLKETVGEANWDSFKTAMEDMQKNINSDKFKEEIEKAKKELTSEDAKKMLDAQKERAKKTHERISNEKAEQQQIDDEIADLQKQIKEKSEDSVMKADANPEIDELKKKIKEAQDKKAELVNKSIIGTASPAVAKSINDRDKENNGIDIVSKQDSEKEDKQDSEKEDKQDSEKEDKQDSEKEDKQGKYKVKEEEVVNPENGKKIKVKTYTGPKGGKFYYPDGKPKTPENKVYVENLETDININTISLSSYLKSIF